MIIIHQAVCICPDSAPNGDPLVECNKDKGKILKLKIKLV